MTSEPTCWQFLIKQKHSIDQRHLQPPLLVKPHLIEISQTEARQFVNQYEWLGNAGAARYCFGLRYSGHLAAVVCFARPTSRAAFGALAGAHPAAVFQLCRGASTHWAPKHAASMLIAWSLRVMESRWNAQLVVAYADPRAGEVGVVYQATNAIYLGMTNSRGPGAYVILGKEYHPRSVHRIFGSAQDSQLRQIDPTYKRIQRTKKHRYVYLLGSEQDRKRLASALRPLSLPYPKRSFASGQARTEPPVEVAV
jgi:hypothetical protein